MIYLDNAATTDPKPEAVYQAVQKTLRNAGCNPGRSGYRRALQAGNRVDAVRRLIAGFFGLKDPNGVVFTLNTTDALNMALRGLLRPGDGVITTVAEHNSLARVLNHLERDIGIEVKRLEGNAGKINPLELKNSMTSKTRLVALSHVSNVTGMVQDIAAIGDVISRFPGVLFLVDAAQSGGILPIDMTAMGIDLLACAGHKALYGPMGTGLLLVSSGVELEPYRVGGSGHSSELPFQPVEMPSRLEAGTLNYPGIEGLGAGVEFLVREPGVLLHETELKSALIEGLSGIPGLSLYAASGEGPALASFTLAGIGVTECAMLLDSEYGIECRSGLHCAPGMHRLIGTFPEGTVRFSASYFNTWEDIDTAVRAVRELSGMLERGVE